MSTRSTLAHGPNFHLYHADQPRGAQLAKGLEHYNRLREHQRQVQQAITELEQANTK